VELHVIRRLSPLLPLAALVLAGCASDIWPVATNPFTTVNPSTDFGQATQDIYATITYWVIGISIVVYTILAYVLIRFRDDGSPGNPVQVHGNPTLEFAWTLAPVFIVIAITIPTIRTIFEIGNTAPSDALEVRVVGKRWWWEFAYVENAIVTANELHVPAGANISLLLESDSVIHSFWVPRLGGKRDAVPGRINRMWFKITDTPTAGNPIEYLGECAEYCGEEHARMRKRVYAHTPEDYAQWVTDMKTPYVFADPSVQEKGEAAFSAVGCAGCHTILGNKTANGKKGPNLTRFGARHSIGAGAAPLDGKTDAEKAELLGQWIRDPDSLKLGVTVRHNISRGPQGDNDGMNIPRPDNDGNGLPDITDDEVNALVTYLLTMK
jgi:cytochrome c oxidase subunit 2